MPRKIVVRHGDDPPDDRVVADAVRNGFDPVFVRPFKGDKLSTPWPDAAGSVAYGGLFNAFEEDKHRFCRDEADWIRAWMAQGISLLGLCQGTKRIARVLGAKVGTHETPVHQFGYYPISPIPEGRDSLPETLRMTYAHFIESLWMSSLIFCRGRHVSCPVGRKRRGQIDHPQGDHGVLTGHSGHSSGGRARG